MSESSSNYDSFNTDDDVYEPAAILVEHIGENDSETSCNDEATPVAAHSFPPSMQHSSEIPAGMPSVERRRRRRQASGIIYNEYIVDSDFIPPIASRPGWRGESWIKYDTAILGILLFFAIQLLAVRDKIKQDIQRTRQEALINDKPSFLPRYIQQIPCYASILLENLMSGAIIQQSKRLLTNPLQSPQILYEILVSVWDILGDFLQQLQYFLRSLPILRTLFGAVVTITGDEVISDAVPELDDEVSNHAGAEHDGENDETNVANGHVTIQPTRSCQNSKPVSREARFDINDLPPAFENEEDYPPGWLMYHPKYGVKTREFLMEKERETTR